MNFPFEFQCNKEANYKEHFPGQPLLEITSCSALITFGSSPWQNDDNEISWKTISLVPNDNVLSDSLLVIVTLIAKDLSTVNTLPQFGNAQSHLTSDKLCCNVSLSNHITGLDNRVTQFF